MVVVVRSGGFSHYSSNPDARRSTEAADHRRQECDQRAAHNHHYQSTREGERLRDETNQRRTGEKPCVASRRDRGNGHAWREGSRSTGGAEERWDHVGETEANQTESADSERRPTNEQRRSQAESSEGTAAAQ
jgi:hypothetical protein